MLKGIVATFTDPCAYQDAVRSARVEVLVTEGTVSVRPRSDDGPLEAVLLGAGDFNLFATESGTAPPSPPRRLDPAEVDRAFGREKPPTTEPVSFESLLDDVLGGIPVEPPETELGGGV